MLSDSFLKPLVDKNLKKDIEIYEKHQFESGIAMTLSSRLAVVGVVVRYPSWFIN